MMGGMVTRPAVTFALGLLSGALLAAGLLFWWGPGGLAGSRQPEAGYTVWRAPAPLDEVLLRVRTDYVDDVPAEPLVQAAAQGLLGSLDRHSAYLDPQAWAERQAEAAGEYAGVGVEVIADEEGLRVARVYPDSPAQRAGLRAADRLLQIDDLVVGSSSAALATRALRGPAGSWLRLKVQRPGVAEPQDFQLQRAEVHIATVSWQKLPSRLGYVRIHQFSADTATEFARALRAVTQGGPEAPLGVLVDLRDNPGGVLDAAVAVADSLLEQGVIVTADGRRADAAYRADAAAGDLLSGLPVAVLVNGATASAAEIVAAAWRDHRRATLLGVTTFGKGSVQTLLPLGNGGGLKLTTARYRTPRGESLSERGLQPDLPLPAAAESPAALDEPGTLPGRSLPERDAAVAAAAAWLVERRAPQR